LDLPQNFQGSNYISHELDDEQVNHLLGLLMGNFLVNYSLLLKDLKA